VAPQAPPHFDVVFYTTLLVLRGRFRETSQPITRNFHG
jgi:hypothetical protein